MSRSPSPFSHIYPSTSTKAPEPFRYSPKRSQTSYYPRRRSRSRPSSSRRSNTPKASSRKSNSPYRSRQHSERNPSKPFQSSPKYKSDRQRHKSGSGSNKHVTSYPSPVRGSASSSPSPPPPQTIRRGVTVAATARTRRSTSRQKSPIPKRLRSKSPLFTATKPSSSSSRHYNDITDVARGMRRATTHAPMGISRKSYVRDHEDIPAPKNVEVITIKDKKKKKRTKGNHYSSIYI